MSIMKAPHKQKKKNNHPITNCIYTIFAIALFCWMVYFTICVSFSTNKSVLGHIFDTIISVAMYFCILGWGNLIRLFSISQDIENKKEQELDEIWEEMSDKD